ncbi:MAG: hypothetical protein IT348_17710 [Candidatus Eisenbacteria bacterium]|nr:hypothetical protein [Candidatus Eisenbacteria bacterium]
MHLIRRVAVIACLAALCAAPAMARRLGTPPPPPDESLSQPHAPVAEVVTPAVNHPGNPGSDETPLCMPAPMRTASSGRADLSRPTAPEMPRLPAVPANDGERREKAKASGPTIGPRVVRAPVARARVNTHSRPVPATPGMGTLLRMGMTVGREISFLEESPLTRPSRTQGGRAPPAPIPTSNSALASPAAPQHLAELSPPRSAAPLPQTSPDFRARTLCAGGCPAPDRGRTGGTPEQELEDRG